MKKEIRIRIDNELHDKLYEYYNNNRDRYSTFTSAIRSLFADILSTKCGQNVEVLRTKCGQNADILDDIPHVRATLPSEVTNNYIEKKKKKVTPKKRACSIPKDFNPPVTIASDENLDHKRAVEYFRNWAEAGDKKYVDWIACYRNACRNWLKDKVPSSSKSTKVNRISLD